MTVDWSWISDHAGDLTTLSVSHLQAALSAVLLGLVVSLPLAVLAHRVRPLRGFLLGMSNVLFTIPSIAVFVLLLPVSGLTRTTTVIGLTIYTLVVLLRNTVEGLDAVPARTKEAAKAMGTRPLRTLFTVELPLALPVIMAGVRIATVMSISLVSVATYIGDGGLGQLFTDGFQRNFPTPVVAGVVLTLLLALIADALLVAVQYVLTPGPGRAGPEMYELFKDLGSWLTSGAQWSGSDGIAHRLVEHLQYSLLATLIAAVIALPIGLLIGHTGRGAFLAINLSSFGRALPTVGLVVLVFLASGLSMTPVYVALVALAIPSIVTNTYAGMSAVDPEVRDAARGQGMRGHQVLLQVEVPLAMPLIMTGLRLALIQVVATATIAAYVSFGGLGRYVFDGLAQRDLVQVLGGAVLVAVVAVVLDLALAGLQRVLFSNRPA